MEVIESSTTSTTFLPHLLKLKQADLRKRIKAKHELTTSLPNSLESTKTITTVPTKLSQSEAGEPIDVTEIKEPSETVASVESCGESTTTAPIEPMKTEPTETIGATEIKEPSKTKTVKKPPTKKHEGVTSNPKKTTKTNIVLKSPRKKIKCKKLSETVKPKEMEATAPSNTNNLEIVSTEFKDSKDIEDLTFKTGIFESFLRVIKCYLFYL